MPLESGKLINDLRVSELKTELEKRGLSTQGVKVVLTVRLNKALRDEGLDPADHVFEHAVSPMKKSTRRSNEMARAAAAAAAEKVEKGAGDEGNDENATREPIRKSDPIEDFQFKGCRREWRRQKLLCTHPIC